MDYYNSPYLLVRKQCKPTLQGKASVNTVRYLYETLDAAVIGNRDALGQDNFIGTLRYKVHHIEDYDIFPELKKGFF